MAHILFYPMGENAEDLMGTSTSESGTPSNEEQPIQPIQPEVGG